ncbi:MAG: glycosyltransferase family 39 protein [Acidobacteria bacterium]|nr:glycosyltransferase family 39 protein [Acidobacteriota bacterium]MCA1610979.1 glycosyltransferase family 39 protein [Acidobacteriota bacterium]
MSRRAWLVLVGIGLAIRIGFFLASSGDPSRRLYSPDSFDYARLAENLRAGHGFTADANPPFRPNVLRTPVYPGFLAVLLALGGRLESTGVAAGVLLSCAAIWLTRLTARRWLADARAGRVASALVAVDLGAAAYANFLLTESLFVVLIVLAFACLAPRTARSESRAKSYFLAGLFLGASILCRPIALGLPIALAIGRPLRSGAVLLAGAALLVVPWVLRNQSAAGIFNVSSVADVNLFYHRRRAVRDALESVEHEAPKEIPGSNDPVRVRRMRDEGWRVILDNPLSYVRLTLVAWLRTFGPDDRPAALLLGFTSVPAPWWSAPRQASLGAQRLSVAERILEGAFLVVLYLLAAGGWRGISDPVRKQLLLSAAAVVLYFLVVSGPEYYGRFRVPVVPFIALMAEAGRPARTSSEDPSAPRGTG